MLLLSLCYQPTDNTITISIIKARDLKSKDINGLSGAPRRIESRIIRRRPYILRTRRAGDYDFIHFTSWSIYRVTDSYFTLHRMAETTMVCRIANYASGFLHASVKRILSLRALKLQDLSVRAEQ